MQVYLRWKIKFFQRPSIINMLLKTDKQLKWFELGINVLGTGLVFQGVLLSQKNSDVNSTLQTYNTNKQVPLHNRFNILSNIDVCVNLIPMNQMKTPTLTLAL